MLENRLRSLLSARRACVRIVTLEESDARDAALAVAADLGLEPWTWSATQGLRRGELVSDPIPNTANAAAALHHLLTHAVGPALPILLDLADHLQDPLVCRALREVVHAFESRHAGHIRAHVVLIDHREDVPASIAAASTVLHAPLPDDAQIESAVRAVLRELHRDAPIEARIPAATFRALVENLRGLSRRQVRLLIADAVSDDRVLNDDDLATIIRGKRELLSGLGVLQQVETPVSLDDIGGLARLKQWVRARERAFSPEARKHGIDPPRGVLLLGVQGAGKSLAAKAIATAWRRPLLRLDPGALYDRYIGESERRLRDALRQAEAMSPVVVWIDEIEKGFASAASRSVDGGLSQRMFGALLTWMQEHRFPVFIVATANDINALPPELLRKGRFDEIFFVDLPGDDARRAIFNTHLRGRRQDPAAFDVASLAAATEGYSGAEIEQAIVAALHESFASGRAADTQAVLRQVASSPPLSVQQHERVGALRAWAKGRFSPAD